MDRLVIKWNVFHSILMLLAFLLVFWSKEFLTASLVFSLSLVTILLLCKKQLIRFPGYANSLTIFRAWCMAFFCLCDLDNTTFFFVFLAILLTDSLDGYLARKMQESSVLGTYLDMETDAFIVFAMTFLLIQRELAPWLMVIPAGLRYFYGSLIFILGINEVPEPKRKEASLIAGFYFGVLVASFIVPYALRIVPQILIALLIVYSFGRSFLFQWRAHAEKKV